METYEKKYKEALERARQFSEKPYLEDSKGIVDYIFPELKESEDERVRKALIEMIHDTTGDELWVDYDVHKEDALSWLEKQCEHKKFRDSIQVGDKVTRNEDGVLVNLSQLKRVAKKQGEHKPAWSEDDETVVNSIISFCDFKVNIEQHNEGVKEVSKKVLSWLNELKSRVQPQPKQWSEEDEKMIGNIRRIIEQYAFSKSAVDVNGELCEKEFIDADNWLKSLRLQNTWKPSDEQMNALDDVISSRDIKYDILSELWKDLKKLREGVRI